MKKGKHMTNKTNTVKNPVADKTPATEVNVNVQTAEQAKKDNELVMSATIKEKAVKSTTMLMNKSQNYVCLYASPELQFTLAPREIKSIDKDLLKELLKNPMVRRFFDKGIVSGNLEEDSKVISAHDAETPEVLKQAVERHDGGNNIVAEVKKFEREGSLNIDLK